MQTFLWKEKTFNCGRTRSTGVEQGSMIPHQRVNSLLFHYTVAYFHTGVNIIEQHISQRNDMKPFN